MVLGIKDDENKFDMLVRNCVAHDGKRAPIQLVDELGCVTRPKIMSNYQKIKNFGSSASVVSYAYFQAFKFPDSMNVHFQCVIQVCRYNCPDPVCGDAATGGAAGGVLAQYNGPNPPSVQPAENSYSNPNQRVFNVDPRNQPRPAGLVISEDALDQYTAPSQPKPNPTNSAPLQNRANPGLPNNGGGTRRGGPLRPQPGPVNVRQQAGQPRSPIFPKIPGFNKRLGDLLSGKAKPQEGQRPVLKRLYKREADEDLMSDHHRAEVGGRPVLKRIYKREAQEMADIETASVIQVLSPGDVAFTLGGSEGKDTFIVSNSAEWDSNNICMSLTSLIGGLVMLLGKISFITILAHFTKHNLL